MSENIVIFNSPQELRDACIARPGTEMPVARDMFANALAEKMQGMRERGDLSSGNAAAGARWQRQILKGEHDAAIRVMLCMMIPLTFFLRTVRGGSESFNFYAIEKLLYLAPKLLSASPVHGDIGVPATCRGTILSILRDTDSIAKVPHSVYLNDYMNAIKKRERPYTSGATQSSSSAHALAAMGLLLVSGKGEYTIPPGIARDTLRTLAGTSEATLD